MNDGIIRPKAGNYFRIGEKIYKAFDDGGEKFGCDRCVFDKGSLEHSGCRAPTNLNCKGLYFEDHTHILKDVELVDETKKGAYPALSVIMAGVIVIGTIIYKLII